MQNFIFLFSVVFKKITKDVLTCPLIGSLNRKNLVKLRPFLLVKTPDILDYIKATKRYFRETV